MLIIPDGSDSGKGGVSESSGTPPPHHDLPPSQTQYKESSTMEHPVNIENVNHPGGHGGHGYYPAYGAGAGTGVTWGLFGFIAFIVILLGVWASERRRAEEHCRSTDNHHDTVRGMDRLGYEMGYTRKELNDMQYDIRSMAKEQLSEYQANLRWGAPYGEHTQRLCTAAPAHCGGGRHYGGVVNGSQISDTYTSAIDHSVI